MPRVLSKDEAEALMKSGDLVPVEEPKAQDRSLSAFVQGAGQGASLGYLPHLQAAAEPVMTKALDLITGGDQSKDLGSYVQRRDENIKALEKLKEENPKSFLAGEVTGAIALPGSIGGKPLVAGAKGIGALGRTLRAAGQGGAIGMLANPGDKEGEIRTPSEEFQDRSINAGKGAFAGGVLQGAGEATKALGKGLADLPVTLQSAAKKMTEKGIDPSKALINALGGGSAAYDLAQGDYGSAAGKLALTYGASKAMSPAVLEKAGEKLGALYGKIPSLPKQETFYDPFLKATRTVGEPSTAQKITSGLRSTIDTLSNVTDRKLPIGVAAATTVNEHIEPTVDPIIQNPQVLDFYSKNPSKINDIPSDKLKNDLRQVLGLERGK